MNVELLDNEGRSIDMDALAKEADKEERKINTSLRNLVGEEANVETGIDEDVSMTSVSTSSSED